MIPEQKLLARYVADSGIEAINGNPDIIPAHLETTYNLTPGAPTDQKRSGRCWIYASLNFLRVKVLSAFGKNFSFSQNFVSFWDKFERANYFLEKMIEMKALDPMDHRLLNCIENLYTEGGEWELFNNVVEKYGLVPDYAMPETSFSGNSNGYVSLLKERLREIGGILHRKAQSGAGKDELQKIKDIALSEVHSILTKYIGTPPKKFLWKEKTGQVKRMTPVEFYKGLPFNLNDMVEVTHFPYYKEGALLKVKDVSNLVEGKELHAINANLEVIKQAVRNSIKDGVPVEFASETYHLDEKRKLFSMDSDQTYPLFGLDPTLKLDKGDRLKYRVTTVAHAMVLIGCDDAGHSRYIGEKPSKVPESLREPLWKVENSWQRATAIFMTDSWFNEYLYSIIIDKKYLPQEYRAILEDKNAPVLELDAWDPYGRL